MKSRVLVDVGMILVEQRAFPLVDSGALVWRTFVYVRESANHGPFSLLLRFEATVIEPIDSRGSGREVTSERFA